jgi:phosphomannomutase
MTAEAVRSTGADLGIAWDGDFDRCFFFDETGDFVDGQYIVALLARASARTRSGSDHRARSPRDLGDDGDRHGRQAETPVLSKTGHAFVKARMRETGAVYGGEMSAHHYFREFFHCDSGMVPWVLMLSLLGRKRRSLSALVAEMRRSFPSSGEINFRVADTASPPSRRSRRRLAPEALLDSTGSTGSRSSSPQWRLNLRGSNTEPLLRLNIESSGDADLIERKVAEDLRASSAARASEGGLTSCNCAVSGHSLIPFRSRTSAHVPGRRSFP